jgi:putative transposase
MPEWFVSLSHAKTMIEVWWSEFNGERPKKALGGLMPSDYARQLAVKSVTVTPDSTPRAPEKL